MSQSDRAIKKFATQLARLDREVKSWRGAQADFTSIENGGNFTFKDGDGNVTAIMGGQDDGSNTIRHVDGPIPPIPSGLSAHVDGPIVQVSWDGSFESDVTHDWHYLEVLAVGPNNEQLTGTINDLSGGETSLAATSQGDWVITARSVSRAGKRSLDGDAGTVAVQLVGLTGAIDAVQASADGKNTIYYSPTEPVAPDGGFNNGDLWFDTSEEGNNTASVWDGNGWVSMEDARLATIIAAQEALESDLQDVQTSVDGKNKITYDPALPPASYVGAVGDTWYRTSGNSMIGFWKWDGAAWVQQALSTTVIPQIDIGAGTFGTLRGARLEANSVSVDKLVVSPNANLISDSSFQADGAGWGGFNGAAVNPDVSFASVPDGPSGVAASVCRIAPTRADLTAATSKSWPMWYGSDPKIGERNTEVVPGDRFRFVLRARTVQRPASGIGQIRIRLGFNLNGESRQWPLGTGSISTDAPLGEWQTVTGEWAHPGGSELRNRLTVGIHSANAEGAIFEVAFVGMYAMVGSTLIQNGAITTDKLAVGSITAESGIIESLDLGTATVGELDGIRIKGKTISGEQLSADAIDGKVITGANIRTSGSGARVQMDVGGLRVFDSSNDQVVQLPSDGTAATFNGELVAKSLTSTGRASFLAEDNRIEPGAGLVLAAGVGDPPSPPIVSAYYPQVKAPLQETDRGAYGLAWADGHFWRWAENLNTTGNRGRLEKISTDGEIVASFDTGDFLARNGVVSIGTELFLLGTKTGMNDRRWVQVFGLDGTYKRQWEYDKYGTGTYQPGIGKDDAGNVLIAQCWVSGELTWRAYNPTNGAFVSQFDTNDNTKSDVNGIYVGAADFGVRRAVVAKASGVDGFRQFPAFNLSTGKYVLGNSWRSAGQEAPAGVVWDGTKWFGIDNAGIISEYSTLNTGDDLSNWWAVYRWAKDVDSDLTIDLSSRISPPARFSWPRRARLKVTAPNLPQGAGEIAPSLAYKTTTPSRTDFHSPDWWSVTGEPSASYYELPEFWYTEPSPSDGNNFPDGAPSTLAAASGLFEVKGDGSGHWGPLTFNADGTMSSSAVPAWIPITTFAAGFSAQTWGDVPAYRVWPDGKVEWRGVIAGTLAGTGSSFPILTIPAAARATNPKNLTVATAGSGVSRIEFRPLVSGTPSNALQYFPNGTERGWVSLDGIYYYKD